MSQPLLAQASAAGYHCLALPTPFLIGPVNVYLVEDDPLTLIDTGPNYGTALDQLERGLAEHGRRIEDLERIVISHQHADHLGLINILARRSGAEICTLDLLSPVVDNFEQYSKTENELASVLMFKHGVPTLALSAASEAYRAWGSSTKVTQRLKDGEYLPFANRQLEILHRPGHSPSDTVLWDSDREILIAADHLIKHVSSNPVIHKPLGGKSGALEDKRTRSLVNYLQSLRQTQELPAKIVLSGHGEPIDNHVSLIDERFTFHARRARKINSIIAEQPRTVFEIAQLIWGDVARTQTFLAFSEVLAHLDLLTDEGAAHAVSDSEPVRFTAPGADN